MIERSPVTGSLQNTTCSWPLIREKTPGNAGGNTALSSTRTCFPVAPVISVRGCRRVRRCGRAFLRRLPARLRAARRVPGVGADPVAGLRRGWPRGGPSRRARGGAPDRPCRRARDAGTGAATTRGGGRLRHPRRRRDLRVSLGPAGAVLAGAHTAAPRRAGGRGERRRPVRGCPGRRAGAGRLAAGEPERGP